MIHRFAEGTAPLTGDQPKPNKKAALRDSAPRSAEEGHVGQEGQLRRKRPKARKRRSPPGTAARPQGPDPAERPGGVTAKELMKATAGSRIRSGDLSGTVTEEGLAVTSPRLKMGSARTPVKT